MLRAASSSRARSACAHAHAQGRGVLLFTGHFGFWEINALVHALTLQPMAVLARPLDNPLLHDLLESVRTSTGNSRDLPAGRDPARAARARGEPGGRDPDRSAHADGRRGVRRLLQPAGGDDVGAGGAGAADRRAGGAGVRAAAAGRPLPHGLRARRSSRRAPDDPDAVREFTQRCTDVLEMYVRRYPELWLWMHRRWRDVPAAASRSAGMFPRRRRRAARMSDPAA